jgi:hypothetical protein
MAFFTAWPIKRRAILLFANCLIIIEPTSGIGDSPDQKDRTAVEPRKRPFFGPTPLFGARQHVALRSAAQAYSSHSVAHQ